LKRLDAGCGGKGGEGPVNHSVNESKMRARSVVVLFVVLTLLILAPVGGFFGALWYIDRERVQDAGRAFDPILPLHPLILSQPIAFHRYCRYVVEFPSGCELCDARVAELTCLNSLPAESVLDVVIETPAVTDRSLACLKTINTFTTLDVTKTSISDEGIADLSSALPNVTVIRRRKEPDGNVPHPQCLSSPGGAGRGRVVN